MTHISRVLYVSTRQWNPGDEFILAGCRSLIRDLGVAPAVEAIYNKSPQVVAKLSYLNPFRKLAANRSAGLVDAFVRTAHFDNSLAPVDSLENFDLVLFCGSPGWFGGRLRDLYRRLDVFTGRIAFLGIGSSNRRVRLSKVERRVLSKADLISVRDQRLVEILYREYGVESQLRTCPALLASPVAGSPSRIERLGLVYTAATTNRGQRVTSAHESRQNEIFLSLLDDFPTSHIICNYYGEVDRATRLFGAERVRYVYDAGDFPSLVSEYDAVISSRVHGCGLASSLGVPNLLLAHDNRAATVAGFGSGVGGSLQEVLGWVSKLQAPDAIRAESQRLLGLKKALREEYKEALWPILAPVGGPR